MAPYSRILAKGLGIASIAGCVSITVADGIAILLRPGYNPLVRSVSDLALGPNGWIQAMGIILGGVGIMACAAGLYLALDRRRYVRLGELSLFLAGVGLVFAAVFKVDTPGPIGHIHTVSSIAAAGLFLPACFLILPAVRERRRLFTYTIAVGASEFVLDAVRTLLHSSAFLFGLHERLIACNALVWISVVAGAVLLRYEESRYRLGSVSPRPAVAEKEPGERTAWQA